MAKTNEELVQRLWERNLIKNERVKKAFLETDRANFTPEEYIEKAYVDSPLSIGHGQTISAPHMVAMMTESLKLKESSKVMEIGTGSGYQAAILSKITEEGSIHTIERVKELYKQAKERLENYNNIQLYRSDGSLGIAEEAPFDRIISTCGIPELPRSWENQLKADGFILAPVGGSHHQRLKRYRKEQGETVEKDLNVPCAFVPMRGEDGF